MIFRNGVFISESFDALPIVHGFSTRQRGDMGSSRPPADPQRIANRRRLFEEFAIENRTHVQPRQIHSNRVVKAGEFAPGCEADASVADSSQYLLSVMTADCVPILLYHPDGVVAAVHAGWRGLYKDVVSRSVEQLPPHPLAIIGPAIGQCCYEVSAELALDFETKFGAGVVDRGGDKPRLDLVEVAMQQLQAAGIEEIEAARLCTHCHPDLFFSYRREGACGRMMAFIGLK